MNSVVHRQDNLDPREHYPHIPEWLVKTIQKATDLNPEKRFESCEHFKQVIEKYGKLATSESSFWSGKVASVKSAPLTTFKPISIGSAESASVTSLEDQCPKCNARVKEEMEFCSKCGTNLQKECLNCKETISLYNEFCPKCGSNIEDYLEKQAEEKKQKKLEEERKRIEAEVRRKRELKEQERIAEEREKKRKQIKKEQEEKRLQQNAWRKKHGWKVIASVLALITLVSITAYRNSNVYAYKQALALEDSGQWQEAFDVFERLDDYRDSEAHANSCEYNYAFQLEENGQLREAIDAFENLDDYKDSKERCVLLRFTENNGIICDLSTNLEWSVGPDSGTNWNEANSWVDGLGDSWRMPTLDELRGLYDVGVTSDYWIYFQNSGWKVWSSQTEGSSSAWYFNFYYGNEDDINRAYIGRIRAFAVRSR